MFPQEPDVDYEAEKEDEKYVYRHSYELIGDLSVKLNSFSSFLEENQDFLQFLFENNTEITIGRDFTVIQTGWEPLH